MEKLDVVISGGGIGGSVAARFAADYGFKTLLIEKVILLPA
jgi:flavin-dependent dehydrogenase